MFRTSAIIFIGIFITIISTNSSGQTDFGAGLPGTFTRFGVSVRSLSLGGAYAAMGNDLGISFYNPAALSRLGRKAEFSGLYVFLEEETYYGFFGSGIAQIRLFNPGLWRNIFGHSLSCGFGMISLASEDFEFRDQFDNNLGEFDLGKKAVYFNMAFESSLSGGFLSKGISLKVINETINPNTPVYGVGVDVGFQYQPIISGCFSIKKALQTKLGFSIINLKKPKLKHGESIEEYPREYRIGVKSILNIVGICPDYFIDLSHLENAGVNLNTGIEYKIKLQDTVPSHFAVRGGYNYGLNDYVVGLGANWIQNNFEFQFDMAYRFNPLYKTNILLNLTVKLAGNLDYNGYFQRIDNSQTEDALINCRQVLVRYPNHRVDDAAIMLADSYDKEHKNCYEELVDDLNRARYSVRRVFEQTRTSVIFEDTSNAGKAANFFKSASENQSDEFTEIDSLNWSLMYIAISNYDSAESIMNTMSDTALDNNDIRFRYSIQKGYCRRSFNDIDKAKYFFDSASKIEDIKPANQIMGWYFIGETLLLSGGVNELSDAVKYCNSIENCEYESIKEDSLHLIYFPDNIVADDALILKAECHIKQAENYIRSKDTTAALDEYDKAKSAYAKILRYYHGLDKAKDVVDSIKNINSIIENIKPPVINEKEKNKDEGIASKQPVSEELQSEVQTYEKKDNE